MSHLLRITAVPTEGVVKASSNTEALIGTTNHGTGTLYITQQIITWKLDGANQGFSIPYRKITCHAISRDGSMIPAPCLYIMINGNLEDIDIEAMDVNDDDEDDDEMTEVFFIPPDAPTLDLLYKAIEECSLLHPDPSSDMSDESDINEGFVPQGMPDDDEDEEEEADIDNLPPAQQLANLQAYLAARLQIGRAGEGGGDAADNPPQLVIPPSSNGNGIAGQHMSDDENDDGGNQV